MPGGTGRYSAISQMLPYLDQAPLYNLINFSYVPADPINNVPRLTEIPMLRCPSDFDNTQPQTGGAVNYMANKGNQIHWTTPPQNGAFVYQKCIKMRDIIDGSSSTAAFSERLIADGNNGLSSPDSDVFFAPGDPMTPDEAITMCYAVDITNLAFQFPVFMGAPWMDGQHTFSWTPNRRSCGFFPTKASMPATSRHEGGVHSLLCDGSARFVSENIDRNVWRAVGSRDGKEVVGEF